MLYRLRKTLRSGWFNHQVRGVLETPSARCDAGSGFLLLSQVCHSDLLMYLLAVKSFARFLPPAEIVVLDDGSLTKSDRDVLRVQLEGVRFLQVRDVPNARCPRGNCWERLLAVVDAAATSYVIQLDADTLTLRDPAELRDFVAGGSCFTLGTGSGQEIVTTAVAAARAREWVASGASQVQQVAEARLERLPGYQQLNYVRGCAALIGLSSGAASRARLEWFSEQMAEIVGLAHWGEWGTDQVASNFLIANIPAASVLPTSRYQTHEPGASFEHAAFAHFIGTHRFKGGTYVKFARTVIRELQRVGLEPGAKRATR
jgi:hypothetical protein